jgi:hypothetical protein
MKKLTQLLKESQHLDYRRMNVGEDEEGQGMTKEEKRAFVEAVAAYRQLGEMISHKGNISEIHDSIKGIVENANNLTLKETGDWFDRVTVQRHMKSMNESFKVFSNTIKEVSTLQQRLESSYDEIGEVLGKYYEIKEGNEFGAERAKAIAAGDDSFEVDGKSYKVTGVDAEDKKNADEFANESMKLTSLIKRNEELTGKQKELDVDSDGDIEADDLADLRAGKKADESVNEAGKLKVGKEDFSFLLKLTDKELVKRLDLIRKQQLINGKQYMTARSKGEDTSKIEKVGENLANQERAVIQARIRLHDIRNTASESVNEGVSSTDMDKIKGAVEAASSFMSVGSELKKLGMKYTFATEPLPIYIIQPTPNNKVAIVNKKYASKPDFVVGDIAVGIMEGKLNEEEIRWQAVENAIINFLKMNTKILDKRVKDRDTDGVKGGLSAIIRGLTNAQRNLKLESVNDVKEITANTSKLFNWFWDASPAKDIAKRVSQLNDKDLLSLYDAAEDLKRNGRLRNPRQIQLALLKKEIDRRGLSESVNEGVKLSLVDPNTNKFIKTLSLDRTYKEAEKEVETLNRRLSSSEKTKGLYWKVTSIGESVNEAGYTVKAENPYQFVNGAYAVLSAYLKDEELGPKGKRELQDIIKSLDYMRKYFYFKMSESVVNEEKYTVIDPMGNQKGVGPKIQAISMAKRLGGEKTGHFVVANTNALKARRALEKFKGDFKNPKLKDMMMNLYYESVNERIVKEKVK